MAFVVQDVKRHMSNTRTVSVVLENTHELTGYMGGNFETS
jgi:hypothetical protein